MAVNPETNRIYVANADGNTVTVLEDTYGGVIPVASIPAGKTPYAVAVNPVTNKIYVANADSNNVTMIDGATHSAAAVAVGTAPVAIAVNTATNKIYVANAGSGNVTVIDGATNGTETVQAGEGPFALAVNEATNKIYVANVDSDDVTVIDGASNAATAVPAGEGPSAIAVNPVTNRIYAANLFGNNVTVIDGATGGTSAVSAGIAPSAVEVNPVTGNIYVANDKSGSVTVIDGYDHTASTVTAGAGSSALALNPKTNKIYTVNYVAGTVTVIDGTNHAAAAIASGKNPIAIAVNAGTNKIYAANFNGGTLAVIEEHRTTDADLSGLAVSAGSLSPAFDPLVTEYAVQVGSETAEVTVTASTYDPAASMTITGQVYGSSASVSVLLQTGVNRLPIVVHSPDGFRSKTYTLTIHRAEDPGAPLSDNADLSRLIVSAGTLQPAFTPEGLTYAADVGHSVSSVSVTAATYDSGAVLTMNGVPQISGVPVPLNLTVGANTVTVVTTAENGTVSKTYVLTITRAGSNEVPQQPEPATESGAPAQQPAEPKPEDDVRDGPDGVTLGSSAARLSAETGANGKSVVTAMLRADSLTKAFGMLKDKARENQSITFVLPGTESVRTVGIPAKPLADAAVAVPHAVISIKSNDASYALPVNVPAMLSFFRQLNEEQLDKAVVYVTMETVSGSAAERAAELAKAAGASLIGGIVKFALHAEADGIEYPFPDYGGTYVARSVTLASIDDPGQATVVLIDPESGSLSFVPSVFAEAGGNKVANLFHTGNGLYAVIRYQKSFADVSDHWSKADVELLASKLIVNGMSDTRFEPERGVTRGEFASLLIRALGLAENTAHAKSFNDISASDWFAGAVGAAAQAQLVTGFEDGAFRPEETITREQMAVMIVRAISFTGKAIDLAGEPDSLPANFGDEEDISVWARASAAELVQYGIITGITDDRFAPQDHVTRAQAAAVVKRLLHTIGFIN